MNYITLKEVEEKYNIKATTLRGYIFRKIIIPNTAIKKFGTTWAISEEWIEEKYEKR